MYIRYFIKNLSLLLLLCLTGFSFASEKTESRSYKLGVLPYLSSKNMQKIYSPASDILSKRLNHETTLISEYSHRDFIHKLSNELYDIVLVSPFLYSIAVDHKNYIPVLKVKEPFSALIVTLDGGPIKSIVDLKGQVVATPPIFSPTVNLAVAALVDQGVIPGIDIKLLENETVDACLQHLIDKAAIACVSPPFVPSFFENEMNVKLHTLLKSSSIPSVALLVHSRVESSVRDQVKEVFASLSNTEQGRKVLQGMQTEGFIGIDDDEYDVVRKLLKKSKFLH